MPASSVAKSKRKSVPREDEDDDSGSGSESGSDVVSLFWPQLVVLESVGDVELTGISQSVINVDFDFFNLNPEVDL